MRHSGPRRRLRLRTKLGTASCIFLIAVWLVSVRWHGGFQGHDYWICIDRGILGIVVNPFCEADLQSNSPLGWYVKALTPQARKWSWARLKDDWNRVVYKQLPDGYLTSHPELVRSDALKSIWRDIGSTLGIRMPCSETHAFPAYSRDTTTTESRSGQSNAPASCWRTLGEALGFHQPQSSGTTLAARAGDSAITHRPTSLGDAAKSVWAALSEPQEVPKYCSLSAPIPDATHESTWISVPIWCFLVPLFLATMWLMWQDYRWPAGCCQGCGFDLRGNLASGRCPECGKPIVRVQQGGACLTADGSNG